jgi:hypothetical protein
MTGIEVEILMEETVAVGAENTVKVLVVVADHDVGLKYGETGYGRNDSGHKADFSLITGSSGDFMLSQLDETWHCLCRSNV